MNPSLAAMLANINTIKASSVTLCQVQTTGRDVESETCSLLKDALDLLPCSSIKRFGCEARTNRGAKNLLILDDVFAVDECKNIWLLDVDRYELTNLSDLDVEHVLTALALKMLEMATRAQVMVDENNKEIAKLGTYRELFKQP